LHYFAFLLQLGEFSNELLLILGSEVGLEDFLSSFVVQHFLHLRLVILCVRYHCSLPIVVSEMTCNVSSGR